MYTTARRRDGAAADVIFAGETFAGTSAEYQEQESRNSEDEPVETKPGTGSCGLGGNEVLIVANVLNGGEGEGEALGELDATNNGERKEAI